MNAAPLVRRGMSFDKIDNANLTCERHLNPSVRECYCPAATVCTGRGGRVNGEARRLVRPNRRNSGCLLVRC